MVCSALLISRKYTLSGVYRARCYYHGTQWLSLQFHCGIDSTPVFHRLVDTYNCRYYMVQPRLPWTKKHSITAKNRSSFTKCGPNTHTTISVCPGLLSIYTVLSYVFTVCPWSVPIFTNKMARNHICGFISFYICVHRYRCIRQNAPRYCNGARKPHQCCKYSTRHCRCAVLTGTTIQIL